MISTWFFGGKLRELIQPWRKINMGQPPFCFERCASLAAFHYTTSFLLYACGRRSGMFVCSMPCPSMCPIVFGGAGSSVQWAPSMSFWRGAEEAERQEPAGEDMGSLVWITSLPASKHTGLLGGRNNPFFFLPLFSRAVIQYAWDGRLQELPSLVWHFQIYLYLYFLFFYFWFSGRIMFLDINIIF